MKNETNNKQNQSLYLYLMSGLKMVVSGSMRSDTLANVIYERFITLEKENNQLKLELEAAKMRQREVAKANLIDIKHYKDTFEKH